MTKVNNRAVIRLLAIRELKSNRKMNVVIILSIILTCVLFTALTSIGGTIINGAQQETMRQVGGDRMAGLKCVLPEDYKKVKADDETRDVVYRIVVGNAVNDAFKHIQVEVNCAENTNCEYTKLWVTENDWNDCKTDPENGKNPGCDLLCRRNTDWSYHRSLYGEDPAEIHSEYTECFFCCKLSAFCGAQRTPMRFRADAMQSITDAPKRSILLFSSLAVSLQCSASLPA